METKTFIHTYSYKQLLYVADPTAVVRQQEIRYFYLDQYNDKATILLLEYSFFLFSLPTTHHDINVVDIIHCLKCCLRMCDVCAGYRSWLVHSPAVHVHVGPSVGHHHHPDVCQLVLLHPAHLPAHLHGQRHAL